MGNEGSFMGIVLAMTRRALMSTALCAAFGLAGPPAWAATPSNSVVIGTHLDDLPTLDPAVAYESTGLKINSNVYDRLLRFEADDPNKLEPGIAESWTASDDGKTITLKIKAGLTFQ